MQYEIVHLNEKTVVGYAARTNNLAPDMGQVIGGLWQRFYQPDGYLCIPSKKNDKALGIYTDYANAEQAEYTVLVACEVQEHVDVPETFVVRTIPAGTYAKFVVTGNMITAVSDFWKQLWKIPLQRSFVCDFEEYQNADPEHAEIHIYISLK